MKKALLIVLLAAFCTGISAADSHAGGKPVVLPPDSIKWMPASGALPPSVGVAVLEGDPSKPGEYTMRLRLPNGLKFPPHWYDKEDRLTIISGSLRAGIGAKWDDSKMVTLPPGSYAAIPAFVRHYAMAKGVTVVQISAAGPRHIWFVKAP